MFGNKKNLVPPNNKRDNAGEIEAHRILNALSDVGDVSAREVMTPRVDVVALPIPVSEEDVKKALRRSNHSRFPVYDEDLDHLVGVLFVKDLLRDERWWPDGNGTRPGLSSLDISRKLRPPYIIPQSRQVLDLVAEMRQRRRDFAVVVDEYGGFGGVLTMKDLLGSLLGDLPDEFDPLEAPAIMKVDEKRWLVDGGTSLDELRGGLHLDLPDGEYVTVAGYVLDRLGEIPNEGDLLSIADWEFKVIEMDRHRISKLVVSKRD